ncbi:hypothetical protein NMH_2366 [Neisseria meningitidis H44/76]|uniref:Uncharacterized protein n=4 Tax=Neisseria meningitidis TaxID=487 RepID=E6N0P9_NEIMH|nr:hypothetical protein NMA510612_1060 [Neisseria meningitidis]EFV62703.1 hypothetical protein NMH_2366 [Neisseria meningitidis H44/76]CBA04526.1 hypothetical protein predicted by Glimmer/Critica [Neisseria meningitidis alpha275]CCA45096.1 hypothetical protein NMALPHA522_1555 [Neisseria meningitidis alpha522]
MAFFALFIWPGNHWIAMSVLSFQYLKCRLKRRTGFQTA